MPRVANKEIHAQEEAIHAEEEEASRPFTIKCVYQPSSRGATALCKVLLGITFEFNKDSSINASDRPRLIDQVVHKLRLDQKFMTERYLKDGNKECLPFYYLQHKARPKVSKFTKCSSRWEIQTT
ncbi:hypothetical protein JCM10212_003096, partial [Sporobolomyces blumeae]